MYHRRYIFIANGSAIKIADLNKYQTSFIPLYYGQSCKIWKLLRNPNTECCLLISSVYIHPLTQLSGMLERRKIKHLYGKWEIHKNIGQKTQRNETLCRLGRKTATSQPIKTWFTVSDNAFKSLRLESRSRFLSSSQKMLVLFTYWLRFVLSRLELTLNIPRGVLRGPPLVCYWLTSVEINKHKIFDTNNAWITEL